MNQKQVILIFLVVLGVLTASTAQLTDIFGPQNTKVIVSVAGLLNSTLAGILGIITGQGYTVREVQDMAGVEKIVVNKNANETLASLAVNPLNDKIESKPGDAAAISETAKG